MLGSLTAIDEIEALAKLLTPVDQVHTVRETTSVHPGNLVVTQPAQLITEIPSPKGRRVADIWEEEEVREVSEDLGDDPRPEPKYQFLYKQAVETTDAFLGMGNKDPSSMCCEDILLRIELPGIEELSDVDLDVQPLRLALRSSKYKLLLDLPHEVEVTKSKAAWNRANELLTVTLRRKELPMMGV